MTAKQFYSALQLTTDAAIAAGLDLPSIVGGLELIKMHTHERASQRAQQAAFAKGIQPSVLTPDQASGILSKKV